MKSRIKILANYMIIAITASILLSGCGALNLSSVSSPMVKVKCRDNAKFKTHGTDTIPQKQLALTNPLKPLPAKDKRIEFHPISGIKNFIFNSSMASEIAVIKTPKQLCTYTWHQVLYGSMPVFKNNQVKSQPKPYDTGEKQVKQDTQNDGLMIFGFLLLIIGAVFLISAAQNPATTCGLLNVSSGIHNGLLTIGIIMLLIGLILLITGASSQ